MHDHYQTVPVSSRCNLAHPKKLNSDYAKPSFLHYGADGETRTLTAFATAPSRRRVYQFHHVGRELYFGISFTFESAAPAGLSGVGTGTCAAGAVTGAGADDAGCVAITPLVSLLCE